MDEIETSLLVIQEANRLTKAQLEALERRAAAPGVMIVDRATEPPAPAQPGPEPVLDGRTTGRGGEFVAPPPQLDPTLKASPDWPAAGEQDCAPEPDADLLGDPAFVKAWEVHRSGRFAVAVFEWNEVLVGGGARRSAVARYYLGDAYFRIKEYGQAVAMFQTAASQPEAALYRPCAAYRAARSLELLGQGAAAGRQYRSVISQYPGSAVAGMARTRLTDLESNTSQ
jgi:TolA-binding protein